MHRDKSVTVGVIAEDDSDVDSATVLIRRISGKSNVGVKRFVGKGCGRINRKSRAWATNLKQRGCSLLILIHDLDRNRLAELRIKLEQSLDPSPIGEYLICIPVEELEAWLLADPVAIRKALKLPKTPKIKGHPEDISSPKEYLEALVRRITQGEKVYDHTRHNEKICKELGIDRVLRCPSFKEFHEFVRQKV